METHDAAMEYRTHEQFVTETHDAAEQFQCIICLELVYKPIVHACGHLFCFWCVHRAMNGTYKNLCPLCRRPYMHFPRICEQLHFVLLKAVHDKYLIRAKEVLEEEAQGGIFSPELHPVTRIQRGTPTPAPSEEVSSTDTSNSVSTLSNSSTSSSGDDHPSPSKDPALTQDPSLSFKGKAPMPDETESNQEEPPDTSNLVTIADLACLHCNNLLYRPVVLNCGHIFCEHCVEVGDKNSVTCPSCNADHPGIFPQVCLELHHYIDRIFPLEYAQRSLQVAPLHRPSLPPSEPEDSIKGRIRKQLPGPVHCAVGCDGCGMMPIVGKRFQCKDCCEAIGFDLCGKCHDSGIVLGRFNQGHTSEHRMLEIRLPSRFARRILNVMAIRSLNMGDLRSIANDCNDAEALQVLLLQQPPVDGSNGASGTETIAGTIAQAMSVAPPSVVEEDGEALSENYVLQDGDGDGDEHLHDGFLHNGGDDDGEFDGQDDEEFEAFSRDDEDIGFFRVVFHS